MLTPVTPNFAAKLTLKNGGPTEEKLGKNYATLQKFVEQWPDDIEVTPTYFSFLDSPNVEIKFDGKCSRPKTYTVRPLNFHDKE